MEKGQWLSRLKELNHSIEPWVIDIDDEPYISYKAPEELYKKYMKHVAIGYENGWI